MITSSLRGRRWPRTVRRAIDTYTKHATSRRTNWHRCKHAIHLVIRTHGYPPPTPPHPPQKCRSKSELHVAFGVFISKLQKTGGRRGGGEVNTANRKQIPTMLIRVSTRPTRYLHDVDRVKVRVAKSKLPPEQLIVRHQLRPLRDFQDLVRRLFQTSSVISLHKQAAGLEKVKPKHRYTCQNTEESCRWTYDCLPVP